jgi:hypothetical protein
MVHLLICPSALVEKGGDVLVCSTLASTLLAPRTAHTHHRVAAAAARVLTLGMGLLDGKLVVLVSTVWTIGLLVTVFGISKSTESGKYIDFRYLAGPHPSPLVASTAAAATTRGGRGRCGSCVLRA